MSKKVWVFRVVCVALVFALGLSLSLTSMATSESDESGTIVYDDDFFVAQAESIDLYNQLLGSFSVETYSLEGQGSVTVYPDYYGGAYIDHQTGGLVILVTDQYLLQPTIAFGIGDSTTNVEYELCQTSYNEIISTINLIAENFDYFEAKGIIIDAVRDDILNGKIIVEVRNVNNTKAQEIQNFIGKTYLDIRNSTQLTTDADFGAGTSIDSGGTIGMPATKNGVAGFVTAGHVGNYVGKTISSGGTTLGSVTQTTWYDNATGDVSFISAATGITPTNLTTFGGLISDVVTGSLPVNTVVYKYGVATGLTVGAVVGSADVVNYYDGDYSIDGLVIASYQRAGGDSGGPILIQTGTFLDRTLYSICGIHSGGSDSNTGYFTPYQTVVNVLGATALLGTE